MTIASIDIGSNTTLLLIAKFDSDTQKLSTIKNLYEVPRISEDLHVDEKMKETKINLLLDVLLRYQKIIEEFKCDNVLVCATNAFRIASNCSEIVDLIYKKFNWNVKVLTGAEEANLTFLGATFPYFSNEIKNVIDIGGGSTEIIQGDNKKINFVSSYNTGVVSLTENYFKDQTKKKLSIYKVKKYLMSEFADLKKISLSNFETIAVAGTPTTLSCIKQNIFEYNETLVENSLLSFNDIKIISDQLSIMTDNQVIKKYGPVVIGREDVLFAGCLILLTIMEILNIDKVLVSNKGLRYGLIVDFLIRNNLLTHNKN